MKKVENRKLKIPGDVEKYSDLIKVCINRPSKDGCDISEMRKRIKVIDVIEKGGKSLEFEDADFECLKQCVKNMRWFVVHKEIIEFVDYISEL